MELYIIRHGLAGEREDYVNDDKRPLTDEGHQKTAKVAKKLYKQGLQFDLILTSPLVRAKQTAEILQKEELCQKMIEFQPLAPGGDLQEWVDWWSNSQYHKDENSLALVGHQPDLGEWAEMLIWGQSDNKLILKKAGIIGIKIPNTTNPVENSELFLLTSPKWLL